LSEQIASVHCIRHVYPDRTEVSLCGVELSIQAGEKVAILAANGAGKTTLLQHLTGLLKPVEGSVRVFGLEPYKDFDKVRTRLGVVFQHAGEQIIGATVRDDVAFGLGHLKLTKTETQERVDKALNMLDITHLAEKVPHYLSGGEQKKVALAGVLAPSPELLILDEPFAELDPWAVRELVALLKGVNKETGAAMVFTSHQLEPVALLADTVYVLHKGHVVAKGTPLEVFKMGRLLEQSRLRAPDLVLLAEMLKERGFAIEATLNLEELAERLLALLPAREKAV